jgi:hypothetical protein
MGNTFRFAEGVDAVESSTALDGRRLGIGEVDDGIWLVTFMRYDLGQGTLQTIDNPFGTRLSPMS